MGIVLESAKNATLWALPNAGFLRHYQTRQVWVGRQYR
jgi:hypothetical protein